MRNIPNLHTLHRRLRAQLVKSITDLNQSPRLPTGDQDDSAPDAAARDSWVRQVPGGLLDVCDEILAMATQAAGRPCRLEYLATRINILVPGGETRVRLVPMKRTVKVAAYVDEPTYWVMRLQEYGLPAHQVRDDEAVQTSIAPMTLYKHGTLLSELIADAFAGEAGHD